MSQLLASSIFLELQERYKYEEEWAKVEAEHEAKNDEYKAAKEKYDKQKKYVCFGNHTVGFRPHTCPLKLCPQPPQMDTRPFCKAFARGLWMWNNTNAQFSLSLLTGFPHPFSLSFSARLRDRALHPSSTSLSL